SNIFEHGGRLLAMPAPPTVRAVEREILDACVARLEALPLSVEIRRESGPGPWDARVTLRHGRQRFTYLAEVKHRLDRARLHHMLIGLGGRPAPARTRRLLVTDLLPLGLVDVLREH